MTNVLISEGSYSFPHIYNLAMYNLAIIKHAMYKIAYSN